MVESTALLKLRTGNGTEGSNPSLTASESCLRRAVICLLGRGESFAQCGELGGVELEVLLELPGRGEEFGGVVFGDRFDVLPAGFNCLVTQDFGARFEGENLVLDLIGGEIGGNVD